MWGRNELSSISKKRGGKKIEKEEDGVSFLVSLSILFIYGKKGREKKW